VAVVGELGEWRFCPRCRAELRHEGSRVECESCGFVAYASSKPTAGALVEDGGRVLLARRAHEPFRGSWDIPGGFLEEGGLEIEPLEFLGAWMDRYGGDSTAEATLNLYWTARVVSGEPEPADDVSELAWFEVDELPGPADLAFENVPLVLEAYRRRRPPS
jgi:NAD+ diphosphatase